MNLGFFTDLRKIIQVYSNWIYSTCIFCKYFQENKSGICFTRGIRYHKLRSTYAGKIDCMHLTISAYDYRCNEYGNRYKHRAYRIKYINIIDLSSNPLYNLFNQLSSPFNTPQRRSFIFAFQRNAKNIYVFKSFNR